ncbi:MAG: phosphoribosyltransferase family protein, partial [Xenophilus sp.]
CALCRAWPARPLCDACTARFAAPAPRCRTCALRVPAGIERCGECLRHPPALDTCLAACDYAWPWPGCIERFKFQGEPGWAGPLAALMLAAPGAAALIAQAERVLPMPLHPRRLRERGFNQALALARRLAPARCDATLLLRLRDTPPQSGLTRARRLRNLRGAFAVEPLRAGLVHGRRILLVDDVMTTGASLAAAAQALREAGAARVDALVLARTPGM